MKPNQLEGKIYRPLQRELNMGKSVDDPKQSEPQTTEEKVVVLETYMKSYTPNPKTKKKTTFISGVFEEKDEEEEEPLEENCIMERIVTKTRREDMDAF